MELSLDSCPNLGSDQESFSCACVDVYLYIHLCVCVCVCVMYACSRAITPGGGRVCGRRQLLVECWPRSIRLRAPCPQLESSHPSQGLVPSPRSSRPCLANPTQRQPFQPGVEPRAKRAQGPRSPTRGRKGLVPQCSPTLEDGHTSCAFRGCPRGSKRDASLAATREFVLSLPFDFSAPL